MGCPPLLWTLLWRSKFRFTSFRRKVIVGGLVLLLGTAVFAWWLRRRIKVRGDSLPPCTQTHMETHTQAQAHVSGG